MEHVSAIVRRVMEEVAVEDEPALDAECWECGKSGDYYDGVCYECAAQPFGLLWQREQEER
jgi:hypothetical protein